MSAAARPSPRPLLEALALGALAAFGLASGVLFAPFDPPERASVGPDDLMRVHLVRAHLDGRPFTDSLEPRLAPPEGADLPWSPIASLALYAAVRALERRYPREAALARAVVWVPPLLGAVYVAALLFALSGAAPLAARPGAPLALLALAPTLALWEFSPGRTDHHGLGVILSVLSVGLALRALRPRPPPLAAPACGAVLGLALVVSLEALVPALALGAAFAGAFLLDGGARRARAGAWAGLACAGVALVAGTLAAAPGPLERALCDRLSAPHLTGLALCALGALALAALAPRLRTARSRAAALAVVVLGAGLAFAAWTPACLLGPYAELDSGALPWLAQVAEAQGVGTLLLEGRLALSLSALALPVAAAVVLATTWRSSPRARDPRWLALAAPAAAGLALIAWQVRGAEYAHAFAVIALAPAAAEASARACAARARARVYALWLAYPLGVLALAAAPAIVFAPPASTPPRCVDDAVLAALNDPGAAGARPAVVVAPIDDAPLLLYRTAHSVLAGGYHPAHAAIADQWRLFGPDPVAVSRVLLAREVDLLVICEAGFAPYVRAGAPPGVLRAWLAGPTLPSWLTALGPPSGEARLYRVDRAALARSGTD